MSVGDNNKPEQQSEKDSSASWSCPHTTTTASGLPILLFFKLTGGWINHESKHFLTSCVNNGEGEENKALLYEALNHHWRGELLCRKQEHDTETDGI